MAPEFQVPPPPSSNYLRAPIGKWVKESRAHGNATPATPLHNSSMPKLQRYLK
ncbi:hypothetical protein BDZ91DRAFT_737437 [Kalaharituber pfeilii]|nr:hypothetical protein BDZ91DRAFT_737437 [Kalaharituber pfeilii]